MICPNCGSENNDDMSVCQFCGQRFAPKATAPADTENNITDDSMYGSWNNNNNPEQSTAAQQSDYRWNTQTDQSDNGWNNQQSNPDNGWNNQQNWNNNGWQQNPQGWPNNGYQQPYNNAPQPANGFAIAALVIGILSIVPCCFLPYISIPMNIVGLVLGIVGYKKPSGRGMSISAIVLNIVFLVLAIIWLIIVLYIAFSSDLYDQMLNQYMY